MTVKIMGGYAYDRNPKADPRPFREEAKRTALTRAKDMAYYFAIVLLEPGKVISEIDAMPETADNKAE